MPVHGGLAIHAPTHEDGGIDEIDVTGLSGLLADDQHVLDAEVLAVAAALVHAARHENGGADEISVAGLSGLLADPQTPAAHVLATTGPHSAPLPLIDLEAGVRGEIIHRGAADWEALGVGAANDVLISGGPGADVSWVAPGLPGAHAATHQDGGADEISVAALSGLLADDQHVLDAEVLLVAAALVHAARHQNGGADEISVAGLSGLLVDDQHVLDAEVLLVAAAVDHNAEHEPGGGDPMAVDAAAATGSLRTLGAGATQAAPGNHTHTLVAEAQSGTFTTVVPDIYIQIGERPELDVANGADVDPFITKTDTFSALSKAVAVFAGIIYGSTADKFKLRLWMGGVQVAETAYLGPTSVHVILTGNRSLSGSQVVKVTVHNYGFITHTLKWFSVTEATQKMHPVLVVGSVAI